MRYFTAILSLIFINIFAIATLLYFGSIARKIEKENVILKKNIFQLNEKIIINEAEYSFHNNYFYLKKLQNIYFDYKHNEFQHHNKRISLKDLNIDEVTNVYKTVAK